MSILSVDTIQPIGSGSTVTLNAAKIVVGTGITFESNGQAIYAGIITATSFSGGLPITSGADNRVITASSASAIQGESNLTYDGNTLQVATDANMEGIKIVSSGDTYNDLIISANRSGSNNHIGRILGQWGSGNVASIIFNTGGDTSGKDDGEILFATSNGGSSPTTRMIIKQDGKVGINSSIPRTYLQVSKGSSGYNPGNPTAFNSNNVLTCFENSDDVEVTLLSPNNKKNIINFGDTDNVANSSIEYDHSINHLLFKVNGGSERFRINNSGAFGLAGTNYGTSGQVLTSGGTNAVPTWATPVTYTEYSSQTLSGANSYAITITGNPKIFEVSLYKLRTVASQNTMYRLSTSAGEITSGYHDISYAVRAGNSNIGNAVRGSGQGQGCLTNYDFTNPDNLISGEARFTRVAAGLYTWQAMYDHRFDPSRSGGDANDQYLLNSKGHIADFSSSGSGIVTQFRIFTSGGGNFTSGTVTVRGIA